MPSTSNPSGPVAGAELRLLHDAILEAIRQRLPALDTVAEYSPATENGRLNTPAALLDLEEMDEATDFGDGKIGMTCRFAVHCILSNETPRVEVECRQFAGEILKLVRRNAWACDFVDYPSALSAQPAEFRPGAKGYESWCVTWEQTVHLDEQLGEGLHPFEVCKHEVQLGGEHTPLAVEEIHLPQE